MPSNHARQPNQVKSPGISWNSSTPTRTQPLARSRRAARIVTRRRTRVEIVERGERQGLIESLHRRRHEVDARLVLDDGAPALAVLAVDDADWLEVERGDIVFVSVA